MLGTFSSWGRVKSNTPNFGSMIFFQSAPFKKKCPAGSKSPKEGADDILIETGNES
jgi:hypothetical protein